ncbi:undecaprenyl-diphosphate phosphatase [Desulfosarcina cetonica]|uniref:undecaprenyl-diphosphate phosphatase n=1 Tax=Desulfosarcina cetonica TaxID=90730 RepID=UPI00155DCD87|nr:undecaprenyl-diphosphate phosphatase [Desulfosarcina cetonica]
MLGLKAPELATTIPLTTILIGALVSAVVGWLALVILLRVVDRGQLHRFAPYCWLVGLITLGISLIG